MYVTHGLVVLLKVESEHVWRSQKATYVQVIAGEKVGTLFNKHSALDICMRGIHPISGGHIDIVIDKVCPAPVLIGPLPRPPSLSLSNLLRTSHGTSLGPSSKMGEDLSRNCPMNAMMQVLQPILRNITSQGAQDALPPESPTSRTSSPRAPQHAASLQDIAAASAAAARSIAELPSDVRTAILLAIADALDARKDEIALANQVDVAQIRATMAASELPEASVQRMRLDERRVEALAQGIRAVATIQDPVGEVVARMELAEVRRGPLSDRLALFCTDE
jgi:hypothetical protein